MAFFLIVPSVMVGGVLLVHALAKRLGLKIYYSTLAAVALLSFVIIFVAAFLSPVPDKKFLACLGGLVLATSLLMTFVNNFLIKRERAAEKDFTEEVKAAYAEELKKDSAKSVEKIAAPIEKFEWENTPPPAETESEPAEETQADKPQKISPEEFPLENVFKPLEDVKAEAIAKALENKDAEPFEKPKPEENFPLQEVFKPLDKIDAASASKVIENKDAEPFDEPEPEENFPLQETFKALNEVKPEMLDKISLASSLELPEEFSLLTSQSDGETLLEESDAETLLEESDAEPLLKESDGKTLLEESDAETLLDESDGEILLEESDAEPLLEESDAETLLEESDGETLLEESDGETLLEESDAETTLEESDAETMREDTLDDLLDKAYDARGKGHIWQAIEHYRKALERYGNDEYAPFVAIDLGNLYKENALYSKAIKIYEDALNLPSVKQNDEIRREFIKNVEYQRVVRDVLLKHQAATTPFAKLPKEILQEIDAELQKTQLHSSQYK